MIEFREKTKVSVYLDGTYVGSIVNVDGGYQYIPKASKQRGEIYSTINDVKKSLL